MKTDVITVSSRGNHMEAALAQAEKVAAYKGLAPKSALHLRLLTEEMMGMMRSITGAEEGQFWVEDLNGTYQLHLLVNTRMDSEKREQLLAVSSSGKNEAAKGLMGCLRDFFDRSNDADIAASPLLLPGMYEGMESPVQDWEWSLEAYIERYKADRTLTEEQREAWDELEKSVVAHVADDVKVSIRGQAAELIIIKKLQFIPYCAGLTTNLPLLKACLICLFLYIL